ncbi:MAG TPA: YcaO-like family protein [Kofleriaceae bacterium]|nr:YcaO-like family protein [Kofleriaceae bacterium]
MSDRSDGGVPGAFAARARGGGAVLHGAPTRQPWAELDDHAVDDLHRDLSRAVAAVRTLGDPAAFAADLSQDRVGVSAVKVLVPGARCADWL